MDEHNLEPADQPESQAQETPKQSIPITRVFLIGWGQLLQPRERILKDFYLSAVRANDLDVPAEASLEELRSDVLKNTPAAAGWGEYAVATVEARLVLVSRLLALWQVFWLSLLPFVLAGWWVFYRIEGLARPNPGRYLMIAGIGIVLFFVLTICGALIQALFAKPYMGLLNRLLKMPEVTG